MGLRRAPNQSIPFTPVTRGGAGASPARALPAGGSFDHSVVPTVPPSVTRTPVTAEAPLALEDIRLRKLIGIADDTLKAALRAGKALEDYKARSYATVLSEVLRFNSRSIALYYTGQYDHLGGELLRSGDRATEISRMLAQRLTTARGLPIEANFEDRICRYLAVYDHYKTQIREYATALEQADRELVALEAAVSMAEICYAPECMAAYEECRVAAAKTRYGAPSFREEFQAASQKALVKSQAPKAQLAEWKRINEPSIRAIISALIDVDLGGYLMLLVDYQNTVVKARRARQALEEYWHCLKGRGLYIPVGERSSHPPCRENQVMYASLMQDYKSCDDGDRHKGFLSTHRAHAAAAASGASSIVRDLLDKRIKSEISSVGDKIFEYSKLERDFVGLHELTKRKKERADGLEARRRLYEERVSAPPDATVPGRAPVSAVAPAPTVSGRSVGMCETEFFPGLDGPSASGW